MISKYNLNRSQKIRINKQINEVDNVTQVIACINLMIHTEVYVILFLLPSIFLGE